MPAARKPRARKTPTAAEQRRRAKQAADTQPAEGPPTAALEHGVVVWRVENPPGSGSFQFVVQTIGDTRPTEISDILAFGIKVNREQRGLD